MRGFTLIETLIYLGIFAIAITGILESFGSIQESISRIQTNAFISQEGNFLQDKISYEISHAQEIAEPTSLTTSTSLDLISDNGSAISFIASSDALFEQNNNGTEQLSSNAEEVNDLQFSNLGNEISFSFVLSATSTGSGSLSRTFSATAYIFP